MGDGVASLLNAEVLLPMNQRNAHRSMFRLMADGLFIPIVLVYALAAAVFGCTGSVTIGGGKEDPNRAHGVYRTSQVVNEAQSQIFFGYWLNGDNDISYTDAVALKDSVGLIRNSATITIVPGSILYEENSVEFGSGRTMTVSISGTWSYQSSTRIRVNWGAAFITSSTYPSSPPYHVAASGTRIEGPQSNDIVFANSNWTTLRNVGPGPLDFTFRRID